MTTSLKILLKKGIDIKCIMGDIDISEKYIKPVLDALTSLLILKELFAVKKTKARLMIARSKGHIIGRKKGVHTKYNNVQAEYMLDLKERIMLAQSLHQQNMAILAKLKISKSNYYRYYKIDPNVPDCKTDQ